MRIASKGSLSFWSWWFWGWYFFFEKKCENELLGALYEYPCRSSWNLPCVWDLLAVFFWRKSIKWSRRFVFHCWVMWTWPSCSRRASKRRACKNGYLCRLGSNKLFGRHIRSIETSMFSPGIKLASDGASRFGCSVKRRRVMPTWLSLNIH
jgi:hypothetical protein